MKLNQSQSKKLYTILENYINIKSDLGNLLLPIPLQKKRNKRDTFYIYPVYENHKLTAIVTDKKSMPVNTIFKMEIFRFLISRLVEIQNDSKIADKYMIKGNGQSQNRIGDPELPVNSIESIIAMNFFNKEEGKSIDRRITVISNILIASQICISNRIKNVKGGILSLNPNLLN